MCQALISLAADLYHVWQPFLGRRLLGRIPQSFSARLARRIVDGNLTPALIGEVLERALLFRRRLSSVLSDSEETLEALFEQYLRLRRGSPGGLVHRGATAQLDTLGRFASHPDLRPQRLHMIPDGRSNVPNVRSTPDAYVTYRDPPEHLRRLGRTERLEITMVTPPVADGDLARRIAEAIVTKVRGRSGVSQLATPLRVQGEVVPAWGSVVVNLPPTPPLSRGIVDQVHALLSGSGAGGNVYEQYRAMQRYLIHQGDTWFSVIRTSPTEFTIRAH